MELLNTINEAARNCVRRFVEDRTDKDGRVSVNALASLARMTGFGVEPWVAALKVGAPISTQTSSGLPLRHIRMLVVTSAHTCSPR